MIFDGRFINHKELSFEESDDGALEHLKSYACNLMNSRLSYYNSADFCSYTLDKLIGFESVITPEIYGAWIALLDELDIVHQMFLYSVSDSKMPIDAKCAFLIELAEPLVEVVKVHTHLYSSLSQRVSLYHWCKIAKAILRLIEIILIQLFIFMMCLEIH